VAAIANRYAKALADVSFSQGTHQAVALELDQFARLLQQNPELSHFYANPSIAAAKKRAATTEILKRLDFSVTSQNFLFVLIDNYRIHQFDEILKAFHQNVDEQLGIVLAEVTTATPMDADLQARLVSRLERVTGKKVLLKFATERALIGGVITRIGDTIYDGSVRQQLELIKARLSSQ
jgi:F-type H+-transporting ATPase subunit delta